MNFLLVQLLTVLIIGGVIVYYATSNKRHYGSQGCGYIVGQLLSNNNWRSGLMFIIAIVLSLEMITVYSVYGFPRSPLVIEVQKIYAAHHGILENGAAIFDHLLGDKYFQKYVSAVPIVIDYGASWWWLISCSMTWLIAMVYLPITMRDEVWRFFHRLKILSSTETAESEKGGSSQKKGIFKESSAPRGARGWFWYIFDEFIVEGITAFSKHFFGGK